MKSVVSLIYDFPLATIGHRKWSTKAEMRSVGLVLAEIIGLPGEMGDVVLYVPLVEGKVLGFWGYPDRGSLVFSLRFHFF